ncbi:transporter substrate-binding domain-containing protein [Dichotomicrobium thermohalophilum]|uniref:transporter substrate-binding domain-containing protein n=1 Tax=Dichotomicrobium thermohalophilum TaxID=933063 RepID=UPI001FE1F39F|nr:transporter substrate-binding domain-containing protein [Dichotomicrobium thermohalophilum]
MARLAWLVMALVLGIGAAQAGTLDKVRDRGAVTCGVSADGPGLSESDGAGNWTGLFPDFCRAVAAAVFADPTRVAFVPIERDAPFEALRAGEIDILASPHAWTFSRDIEAGVRLVGALYYASYGLMVPRRLGVATALELSGADICVTEGGPAALYVADYFRRNNMPHTLVSFANAPDALQAYEAGRCDVYADDLASLDPQRQRLDRADAHLILSDVVGIEPLSPALREGDPQWADIVRWTLFALIAAETLSLNSDNVEDSATSSSPLARGFVGADGDSRPLGLDPQWAYNIIAMVGNYGELFARNLGEDSPLDGERRLNRLWREGGLLSAPPIR